MKKSFYTFDGIAPAVSPHLVKADQARTAVDVDLSSGALQSVATDLFVITPTKVGTKKSIYKFGKDITTDATFWFHWLNDTDVTRGTVANDVQERTYYTEAGQPPKVTDAGIATGGGNLPFASYLLGLPSPTPAVTAAKSGTPDPDTDPVDTVVMVTYVTGWGEEGPPSAASNQIQIYPGETLDVTGIPSAPAGAYNVVSVRIYVVSVTSDGQGAAKFWKSVAVGTASTSGLLDYGALQETLEQPYQLAPPTDLFGIMAHPNRFLIGFSKNMVCRSEVNRGHGWPSQYQDPMDSDIVGGCTIGSATVICTKNSTVIGEASDPLNYSFVTLQSLRQPCVSKRSIVATDSGVAYASADGLVVVDVGRSAGVVTLANITEEQWRSYKPETMMCAYFAGRVLAFFDRGEGSRGCLEIDLARKHITESTLYATAAHAVPRLKALYLQVGDDIVKWRYGASRRTLKWGSPTREFDRRRYFAAGRVVATTYPLTFRQYINEALVHTETVANRESFTITPTQGESWRVEVEGGDLIRAIEIATSRLELLKDG